MKKRSKPVSCAERKRFVKNCGLLTGERVGDNKQKICPNLTKRTDFLVHKTQILVGMTEFEPATSWSQRNLSRFFPWFTRLFGAFVSENNAFECSYKHCFHVVRSRRWSKMWSSPFRWDMDTIRKSKIRLHINSFSAVIIAYFKVIVKSLLSTLKICIAEVKEKPREKSPNLFSKKCWTSSPFCGMLLC